MESIGNVGVGEGPRGRKITKAMEDRKKLVVGSEIEDYRNTLHNVKESLHSETDVRSQQTYDLWNRVHVVTGIEAPLLDLLGKYFGLLVASLLGEGKQRDKVKILGYLFFVRDRTKTDLLYVAEENNAVEWYRIRHDTAMTPETIVRLAKASQNLYGFHDFKLKGGVLSGKEEMQCIRALKKTFPDARITLDPNGGALKVASELCIPMKGILTYCENPCGAENGYSSRKIMSEFRRKVGFPTATNMVATECQQLCHSLELQSVDIPLAYSRFWAMEGSARDARPCNEFGLTWGSHSNNHFDISLAIMAHVGAAAPGTPTALDTHWIWQEGLERLTKEPMKVRDEFLTVTDKLGLGIEPDMGQIAKVDQLHLENCLCARDDVAAMQYLIPGWKFDPKKPAMVR